MIVEFILVAVTAQTVDQVRVAYFNRFTTSTACERAAQALRDGSSVQQQEQQFVCVKYKG